MEVIAGERYIISLKLDCKINIIASIVNFCSTLDIKNKMFWLALIPAVLLLVQAGCAVFGIELDFGDLQDKLLTVVNALFAVLVIPGIVVDPTTDGLGDSKRAMSYEEPWSDQ